MIQLLLKASEETLIMVLPSTIFSVILGFIIAVALVVTDSNGLSPNKGVYKCIDAVVNVLRGFPFVILMVAMVPITRLIVGTSLGETAAVVPLTVAASPFVARIFESALKEVDYGVIEAAKSFGASNFQIIFKVMLKEAIPSILSGITLTVINLIGYSAMAGALGAGGLGNLGIRYGFQRFQTDVMVVTVIVLIIVVQALQSLGNYFYKKLSR